MSKVVDGKGTVHQKSWDGQYRPKQGLFGPKTETDWLGNPKIDRDWLGNPKVPRDWLGRPIRSASGSGLYSSGGSARSSRRGSSSGGSDDLIASLVGWLVGLAIALALGVFVFLAIPLFVALWDMLSSPSGRRTLGLALLGTAVLVGAGLVVQATWQGMGLGYVTYQTILYLLLLALLVTGILWGIITQGWLQLYGTALGHVAMTYLRNIVRVWDKVWSWF